MKTRTAARLFSWLKPDAARLGISGAHSELSAKIVFGLMVTTFGVAVFNFTGYFYRNPSYSYFWDSGTEEIFNVATAALIIYRAVYSSGTYRKVWIAFGSGMVAYAISNVCRTVQTATGWSPAIGPPEILSLCFYPGSYLAVVLLMKAQVRNMPKSVWLDGAVGALTCAAVAVAFEYNNIVASGSGGTAVQDVVYLCYPIADVLEIALLVALLPLSAWRPGRIWALVAGGLVLNSIGDFATIHLDQVSGTPWNVIWDIAWIAFAIAPWQKQKPVGKNAFESWGILAMPVVFALVCVGLLYVGTTQHLPLLARVLALAGVLGSLVRVAFTFREIRSLAESRQQARTDELTELGNRRYFYEHTTSMLRNRPDTKPLALLVIDLDRFKEINDSLGHQIGDGLLRQLGPRIKRGLPKDAVIARLGGDEFAVVLDHSDAKDAQLAAQKLVQTMDEPFVLDGVPVRISASIGISLFPDHANEADGLLQHADVAMYTAKRGRSGPQVYSPDRDSHTRERLRSIHELRHSIESGRLVVYYQPQVDSKTGRLIGSEALVRMKGSNDTIIPPDSFLPLAEQAGLMRNLTDQVVKMVLDDCVRWRDAGHPGMKVSINLSVTNLLDVGFPDMLAVELAARNMDASTLVFEVTEGTMLSDLGRAQEAALRLRAMGAEMSLDDYGTGYASLTYLREFPLDEIKLDRSFVANLENDAVARTFVRSACEVAHALGMRVVAEGIETREIWGAVNVAGGDVCQGYLFSKPLPAEEFLTRIVVGEVRRLDAEARFRV